MVYGNKDKQTAKLKCESCGQWFDRDTAVYTYGPDQISWFDGEFRDRIHWHCSDKCREAQ